MPIRRRTIRALAYHHPGANHRSRDLPTVTMWVDQVPDGLAALRSHPIFQVSPLGNAIREQMLDPDKRLICKDVRFTKDGPIEALVWCPQYWHREEVYRMAKDVEAVFDPYRPNAPENRFSKYDHWLGMTKDRVWKAGGGERDHGVLGTYVHMLERLDGRGNRLPHELTGEIPEDDEGALGDLAL